MKNIIIALMTLTLAACVSPDIEKSAIDFNQSAYDNDLNNCRGGTVFEASATSIGLASGGAILGVIHAVPWSSAWDNGWEVAAISAALGGAIGFGAGAIDSVNKYEDEIASCLSNKGYIINKS